MSPKKSTTTSAAASNSRVSKSANSPKGTSPARPLATIMTSDNFLLLWLCYESTDELPDYQAIADRLGISRHATHQRFYTLRNYFKGLKDDSGAEFSFPKKKTPKGKGKGKKAKADAEAKTEAETPSIESSGIKAEPVDLDSMEEYFTFPGYADTQDWVDDEEDCC